MDEGLLEQHDGHAPATISRMSSPKRRLRARRLQYRYRMKRRPPRRGKARLKGRRLWLGSPWPSRLFHYRFHHRRYYPIYLSSFFFVLPPFFGISFPLQPILNQPHISYARTNLSAHVRRYFWVPECCTSSG